MKSSGREQRFLVPLLCLIFLFGGHARVYAWSEHTLLAPVLATLPEITHAAPVKVETLEAFLTAEEKGLAKLLEDEEAWDKSSLAWYLPRPEALAFKASGDPDIRNRFCQAIRVNPRVGLTPYLQLLPGEDPRGHAIIPIQQLTYLKDTSSWDKTVLVALSAGEQVPPLAVVNTASDEPDFGLDIGLFTDNGTDLGKLYGFGVQPFGNPNLEFGSQAPFHMGFYHEAPIIFRLAGFLKQTYPEYRIHLYKRLAEYAFQTGHPYWGWRFTGWGLHYLADLAEPYHATVLPGVSTARALWINTLATIGIAGPKNDAIQLVSNRHLALEKFVQIELDRAYRDKQTDAPILAALRTSDPETVYTDSVPREAIAKTSHANAALTDQTVAKCLPRKFVSDPHFEFGTTPEQDHLVEIIRAEKGEEAISQLRGLAGTLLIPYRQYGRSYVRAILNTSQERK